jgi:PAS domain S-box-containing protein
MSSVSDTACINVICDTNGIVVFQALARATDDWASGDGVAPHVGKPLVKTYWFDHLDCDHRDLLQVLRRAGAGVAERARVWMRVDEHQLIRAELTATPLTDSSGQTRNVLVRTEPSAGLKRKRESGEPMTKPVSSATVSPGDPLNMPLGVPMLRVDLATATVTHANSACAELLRTPLEEIAGLPLTEFVIEAERRTLIEKIAPPSSAEGWRVIDLHLLARGDLSITARVTLSIDPADPEASALLTIRDLTAEQALADLLRRVETLTAAHTRGSDRLKLLEGVFDRAPIALALFDRGQLLRSNRAFDSRPESEIRGDIQALQRGETPPRAITFRTDDPADAPLALITGGYVNYAEPAGAITWALGANPRLVLIDVAADETLSPRAGSHALLNSGATTLDQLVTSDGIDDVRSAILVARTGRDVEPLDVRLADGGYARIGLASDPGGDVLLLLEDETDLRSELDRVGHQLQQQSDALAEVTARASAIDPVQFANAVSNSAEREAQLHSLVAALGAGTFTWDIDSGRVSADSRAMQLLGTEGQPTTVSHLLAAATLDERRAFEQRYFDAVSGDRHLDLSIHIGPERHAVRLIGHVVIDEKESNADPRSLFCIVVDLDAMQDDPARFRELESQLALRTAELNAILESSRDAIRIVSGGTLRHNSMASELFSENINAFMDASDNSAHPYIQSTRTPIIIDGEQRGVVSVSSDQSDTIQLQRREAEINAIFANTGVAIAILDESRCFREVNSAMCATMGYSNTQLLGRKLSEFVHTDDQPTLAGEFEAVDSGELQSVTSDVRLMRRDREGQWVHLTVTRPRGGAEHSTIVLAQDIGELRELRTVRERINRELQESRERYERIASTVQDVVICLTPDGQLLEANGVARTLFALDGRTSLSHLQFIAPETGNELREPLPWRRPAIERASVMELNVVKPDGTSFIGRFTLRGDEHGNITLNVADVTRLHSMQEELQKAYARIVESHTLLQSRTRQLEGNFVSAVQQLGAAIASSYGSAKALRNDARLPKPLSTLASRVVDAFRVHRRLVQYFSASASASRSAGAEEAVDVHALANDAIQSLAERYNIAGRIEVELDAPQHRCRLDGALVRHAFWSIFAHAVSQASKSPARVTSKSLTSTRGTGRIRFEIQWPGARSGTAELNLADALIQSCGGTFEIIAGTDAIVLSIEFDLDQASGDAASSVDVPQRHVLLVEDHESTARVLRRQLERLGCVVSHAGDLAAARAVIEDRSDVDLLICDLTLPDEELDAKLTALLRRLDMPAIALRSYGGVEPPEDLIAMGFVDHIDKPVDLNALSAVIARFASAPGE